MLLFKVYRNQKKSPSQVPKCQKTSQKTAVWTIIFTLFFRNLENKINSKELCVEMKL